MQRLTVRQQIFLFIGISAAVLALILAFVVYPAVQHILELQKTIKETHTFLENRYQSIQKAKKSVAALPDVEEDAALFEKAVLAKGEELAFITQLEKLAERHRIDQELSAVFIDDAKKQVKLRRQKGRPLYQFSFLNRGSYQDHMNYLEELERSPYYLFIDRIVFEKETKNQEKKDQIVVRFDGYMYAAHQ